MSATAGPVRDFAYDVLGRQTSETWYDNVADADAGQNARNQIDWTYDLAGRPVQVEDDFSSYDYDRLDGLRSWLKASIGGTDDFQTNFAYDAHLRTDWIAQTGQTGGNAVAEKLVDPPALVDLPQIGRCGASDRCADHLSNGTRWGYYLPPA